MEALKTLFSPKEAASYVGVSYRLILKWIADGELKCYRIDDSGRIRISTDQIHEYLRNHEVTGIYPRDNGGESNEDEGID